jgi:cytochrome c oxidase subunit II
MIQIQDSVFILSLILMGIVLSAFVFVVMKSATKADYKQVQTNAYRYRRILFGVVVLGGVFVSIGTTRSLPYGATHDMGVPGIQINVEGKQWYWVLSQDSVAADTQVTFNVTSGDVNHGFGIYDSDLRLVAQTQAMPGYTNRLVHTFDRPGNYQIMCLEYCGLVHHGMIANFTVTAPATHSEL